MAARILWAIVVGFFAGVFLRSFVPFGFAFVGFLALLAVAALLVSFVSRTSGGVILTVALLALGGGVLRMDAAILVPDPLLRDMLGEEVVLEGIVVAEPDVREASVRLVLQAEHLIEKESAVPVSAGVLAIVPLHIDVQYGDRMRAKGTLRMPESFGSGTGREFNYPAYLVKSGILYELAFAEAEHVGNNEGNLFVWGALWIKHAYLDGLQRALPEPSAGLAGGITVGDKRALGGELSDTFRAVALIHIVVLSGYNIMVVINALSRLLARAPQAVRFGLGSTVALAFVVMTGAAAPSVRAAAMAIIGMVGRMSGRMYLAIRALAVVALGMVLWNPYVLAFDPGFQLSVIATWGITALTPVVTPWFSRLTRFPLFHEIAATTTATQIAVLPLLLYQSGEIPMYALLANLLVLAVLPAAMFFSALAALAGLTLGPLAPIVAFPAHALLSYAVWVAEFLGNLPFASVPLGAFSAWWFVPIYAGMGLWVLWRGNRLSNELPQNASRSHAN